MAKSNQKPFIEKGSSVPGYIQDWIGEKVKQETNYAVKKQIQLESVMKNEFKDIHKAFGKHIQKAGLKVSEKSIQKLMTESLAGDWVTDKKFSNALEKYGVPAQEALFKAGYNPEAFRKKILELLGYSEDRWSSFGFGGGTYQGPL